MTYRLLGFTLLLLGACTPLPPAADAVSGATRTQDVRVEDFHVTTVDAMRIFVREIRPPAPASAEPLVLIHGARAPGIASFDLPVPNGSLARDLALRTRRIVYLIDARGYGGSTRGAAFSAAPASNPPQSRAYEVVRDIEAVVDVARTRSDSKKVTLLGWATGGMWAAFYASLRPDSVGHLILMNALYGGSPRHTQFGPGSSLSDPRAPTRINPELGAYARYEGASLLSVWDRSIPDTDKSSWRDPAIAAEYVRQTLASDTLSAQSTPPTFRAPLGALEDSFYQAGGRRLFDAASISSHVLLVRSERDFWSRPEDVSAFVHDAGHAASVRVLNLPEATHFVHLDRPHHGRARLIDEICAFLDVPKGQPQR